MNFPEPEDERPISWKAILSDTAVYSSDGVEVGRLVEVLGSQDEDIFHGIVVGSGVPLREAQIAAAQVSKITNKRLETSLTSQELSELPVYNPEESYKLGLVGRFRKHVGWVHDDGESGPKA